MTVWRKNPEAFLESRIDDETLLITMDEGRILSLEGTGRAVWDRIDQVADQDALVSELARLFEGTQAEIAQDVTRFCEDLARRGLIRPA